MMGSLPWLSRGTRLKNQSIEKSRRHGVKGLYEPHAEEGGVCTRGAAL
jgi:hypothetical protein